MRGQQIVSAPDAWSLPDPQGIGHVFVFKDLTNAAIRTDGPVNRLYRINGTDSVLLADSGMDEWYNAEDNTGYIVHTDKGRESFWVIDYSARRLKLLSLEPDLADDTRCQQTSLLLTADIPEISYFSEYGQKRTIDRRAELRYTSLTWLEEWQDSVCIDSVILYPSTPDKPLRITAGAPLRNTVFRLSADPIAIALGLEPDTILSDEYEACAVAAHPVTVTTIRGTEAENIYTNELERPTESTTLKGSAPLDILFTANGNSPVARYYEWRILQGNDLVVQRNDESHRYVFDDYGEYRVLLWVSNDQCRSDSIEIQVSVSASQLLVPNVFTPNGDGSNDEFRVMYRSIIEFDCWVYNRWGHLVYHWNDPAKGWDGTINGRPAAEGAYYYVIRAKGADAEPGARYHRNTLKNPLPIGVYQLSGDINLIRGKK